MRGPEGSITAEWRQTLRERRDDLLAWLQSAAPVQESADRPVQEIEERPVQTVPDALACVASVQTFVAVVEERIKHYRIQPGRVALDLETTGLDPRQHKVVSIALGMPGHVTVIDLRPYYGLPADGQATWREVLCELFEVHGITWIGQNIKFDWQFLAAHFGVRLGIVYDTMLVEQILHAAGHAQEHSGFSLRDIAARYQLPVSKAERCWFVGLDARPEQWQAPFPAEQLRYMVQGIEIPYQIAEKQQIPLKQYVSQEIAELEHLCLPAVASMELHGVLIDQERWRHALHQKEARRAALATSLRATL